MIGKAMMLSLPMRNMESRIHWTWSLGLALAVLSLAGGQPQESLNQPTNAAPALNQQAASAVAGSAPAAPDPALAEQAAEDAVVNAPAKPMSTAKPLPPSVRITAPVAEVLKLADSGVDEGVLQAYVTNSPSTFNLGAEEIIYLNDVGVPSTVVTAMIQRDQVLRELSGNAAPVPVAPAPAEPAASLPEPVPAPAPADMAPQPDYTGEDYAAAADSAYAPFYDSLAPYGSWADVEGYGPCWQPAVVVVNPGWQPYCNGGRWVYSDCGWYWLSDYSWGWAPFHYGRWFRHSRMGWCWQPGNTWGPSWVCWRYGGNYCGWAPLPPAAGYRAGIGLTFHGQRVSGSCAFGLGTHSFSFVEVSHFSDRHPHRYALPRQQAEQVYHQTAPSTTIVGNHNRVVNRGIPVSRVETATHTQIHRVGIREVNNPGAQGLRNERLEGNNRTLSVFRPQFPQPTGTEPAAGGRLRSDIRPGSSSATFAPTPASPRVVPVPSPRMPGRNPATQPNSSGGSVRRLDHSANQTFPPNSLIIRGNNQGSWGQSQSFSPATEVPQSRPTGQPQNTFSRPAATQRSQPLMTTETQSPWQARWSSPRGAESHIRTERPQQYAVPTYSAPAPVVRSAPAPVPAPQPVRSYSPPAASPAPRAPVAESRPAYSPPATYSAPAPSSSPAPSHSSSGRDRR
jgi:hypothetical protein